MSNVLCMLFIFFFFNLEGVFFSQSARFWNVQLHFPLARGLTHDHSSMRDVCPWAARAWLVLNCIEFYLRFLFDVRVCVYVRIRMPAYTLFLVY